MEGNFNQKWVWLKRRIDAALSDQEPLAGNDLETSALPNAYQLTEEAEQLLIEAAQDRHGRVLMAGTMSGLIVQANGKQLAERMNPRSEAAWRAAVRLLLQLGLLEGRGSKGEVFAVTAEGYRLADDLQKQKKREIAQPAAQSE